MVRAARMRRYSRAFLFGNAVLDVALGVAACILPKKVDRMLCRNLNIDVGAMTISSRRRFIAFVTICGIIRGYASVKYNRFRVLNWAILTYYAEIIYILRSVLVRAYFPLARVVGPTVLSAIMIRILQQRLRQFVFRQGIAPIA